MATTANRPRTEMPPSEVRSAAASFSHHGPRGSPATGCIQARTASSKAMPSASVMSSAIPTKVMTPSAITRRAARAATSARAKRRRRTTWGWAKAGLAGIVR